MSKSRTTPNLPRRVEGEEMKIGEREYELPFAVLEDLNDKYYVYRITDASGKLVLNVGGVRWYSEKDNASYKTFAERVVDALNGKSIDILLFCPNCGEQHIDEAEPDVCETCGNSEAECGCSTFTAWLNPSHKSHRCHSCNHVWRPSDVPTNGVAETATKGEADGNPRPRYYATAKDASASLSARIAELENFLNTEIMPRYVELYEAQFGSSDSVVVKMAKEILENSEAAKGER